MKKVLAAALAHEGKMIDDLTLDHVVTSSQGNLRVGYLACEYVATKYDCICPMFQPNFCSPQQFDFTSEWKAAVNQIWSLVQKDKSVACLAVVRSKLYDLLTHAIPATSILKVGCLSPDIY